MFPMHTVSCLVSCLVIAVLAAPTLSGESENKGALPVVVLLGDSIRIQYQTAVRSELKGKATVWTPKENCCHTAFTIEHLEKWVKGRNAAVVHINVGLHDLFINKRTNRPRHSLDVYAANLRTIFAKLKELTHADIIFALTTPVDEKRQATSKTYGRVVRRNSEIAVYNQEATEVARASGIHVDDVHSVLQNAGVQAMISDDGVHLSPKAVRPVAKQVAHSVLAVLAERPRR